MEQLALCFSLTITGFWWEVFVQEKRWNLFQYPGYLTAKLNFMGYFSSSQNCEHLDRILFHPHGCSELSVTVSCVKSLFSRGLWKQPLPFTVIPQAHSTFSQFWSFFILAAFISFWPQQCPALYHMLFSAGHTKLWTIIIQICCSFLLICSGLLNEHNQGSKFSFPTCLVFILLLFL